MGLGLGVCRARREGFWGLGSFLGGLGIGFRVFFWGLGIGFRVLFGVWDFVENFAMG